MPRKKKNNTTLYFEGVDNTEYQVGDLISFEVFFAEGIGIIVEIVEDDQFALTGKKLHIIDTKKDQYLLYPYLDTIKVLSKNRKQN
ncbi:MAG: hypothetical protein Q8P81_02250 [Nanoarchaeota archaeon]|nr:hypothetical protein [Nanoarchaeota archaeon]